MDRPDYVMRRSSKHHGKPCSGCGQRIRVGRKFVLDPERYDKGLPLVYHRACYGKGRER